MFGSTFLLPLYLQNTLGYTATQSGAVFLPVGIIQGFISPVAGAFSDKVNAKIPLFTGIVLLITSFILNSNLSFLTEHHYIMTAYIHNDMERYTYLTDTIMNHTWKSNTFLGGILSKQQGQRFRYIIQGEFGLIGSKSGTFSLDGDVRGNFKLWKDSVSLTAKGFVRSEEPSFFLQDYESNHFKWHNNFGRIFRTNVSGVFAIPTRKFSLKVSVENVKNYIYFDKAGLPQNNLDNIQIVSAYLRQDFSFKAFTLENTVAYQVSSNQNIIPLPDISLYNNLYYHGTCKYLTTNVMSR